MSKEYNLQKIYERKCNKANDMVGKTYSHLNKDAVRLSRFKVIDVRTDDTRQEVFIGVQFLKESLKDYDVEVNFDNVKKLGEDVYYISLEEIEIKKL